MINVQHFVSISGGKDSTAVACLAVERAERRDMNVRFLFADTGNEHEATIEHVDYIGRALGIKIETVRADFSDRFEARRIAIARDWPNELRRKQHSRECLALCNADLSHAERVAFRDGCDCPTKVSPPVPQRLIDAAVAAMQPSGNPFLDMGMLHGRFPGSQTRFCTEELKLDPMEAVKGPVRMAGTPIIEWIGTRADESKARAKMPVLERQLCSFRAAAVLYRPIHHFSVADVFAAAHRHGLKPNPLYLQGMGRVGCMPCIMCKKGELREIANRFPEHIDRIEKWESIVGAVARHANTAISTGERDELISSFLPTDKVPRDRHGKIAATIRRAVEWSNTSRGGRNFDLLFALDAIEGEAEPARCSSEYGLCE